MDNNQKETFNYTYSAKDRDEIEAIRSKYTSAEKEEDKMTQLRRLDRTVTKKASILSIVLGCVGALIMGSGMSLAMTDIGDILQMSTASSMLVGIITGIMGMILVILAYPLYNSILKTERKRIAPEILRLTEELMK